ncbi:farnesyl-diphosphate farnesyltransferase [Ceraceosorus guamensis]|uniref:Squalene synthase n=1 Tax=Ceraceosorus guamensis TaxID=1522189 RepID=A0A316VST6_9BASI|nr:farnesyl-diphosphate farnesyltransferase [Ceraceosorus guamensis]PWN40284.1 farnesyl-diphosphate farnesyltransferase [Ceraceosorus guamensis]
MSALSLLWLAIRHPSELRSLVTYKVWRDPLNDIKSSPDSGWERQTMKDCWSLLDDTSRSFAAVIKELKGELCRVICIFYLVLRALDTIEDDMTIAQDTKVPMLRQFYKKLQVKGWNFDGNGPDEKDRHLLVQFDKVIDEFARLDQRYQIVISDICAKMGAGMASYILATSQSQLVVQKWSDYDLYCHFVAGLVGEGLSRLFGSSGIERPWLADQLSLSNHMGLFLQKTNIIRDYAEDCEDGRHFWPAECYSAHGFAAQPDVAKGIVAAGGGHFKAQGELGSKSMDVLSSMLLDAVQHATKSLDYLSLLREQSCFNFCAIPQVMAIATLELMFANPDVFKRNVKIRKSQAVQLILRAVNPRDVAYIFLEHVKRIRGKLSPADVNFVAWTVELGRIEVWCETYYPSFIATGGSSGGPDGRAEGLRRFAEERATQARVKARAAGRKAVGLIDPKGFNVDASKANLTKEEREAQEKKDRDDTVKFFVIILLAMTIFMALIALGGWLIAWYVTQDETDPLTKNAIAYYRFAGEKFAQYSREARVVLDDGVTALRKKTEL